MATNSNQKSTENEQLKRINKELKAKIDHLTNQVNVFYIDDDEP